MADDWYAASEEKEYIPFALISSFLGWSFYLESRILIYQQQSVQHRFVEVVISFPIWKDKLPGRVQVCQRHLHLPIRLTPNVDDLCDEWFACVDYVGSLIIILWSKFAYVASLRICCGQPKYAKVLFPRPPSDAFRLLKRPEAFVFGNIRKWKGYKWFSNALVFPIFDTIKCEDFYHRRKNRIEFNTAINIQQEVGQHLVSWSSAGRWNIRGALILGYYNIGHDFKI